MYFGGTSQKLQLFQLDTQSGPLPKGNHVSAKVQRVGNTYFINVITFINQFIFCKKKHEVINVLFSMDPYSPTPAKFFINSPVTDKYIFSFVFWLF